MSKECIKCGVDKELTKYYKHSQMSDGHLNKCKECNKKDTKANLKRVGSGYDFSEKGVIRVLYKTQKRHQKLRGHGELPYTKREFSNWLYENNYTNLYAEWVASGNVTELKPSVDRLDDHKGYSFGNTRLVTWEENRQHQAEDILKGVGTSGKRCIGIQQFSLKGELLKEFVSYQQVRRELKYCVNYTIKHGNGFKGGYEWKLK